MAAHLFYCPHHRWRHHVAAASAAIVAPISRRRPPVRCSRGCGVVAATPSAVASQPFAAKRHYHQRHVIAQPGVCGSPPLPSSSPSLGPPPACAAIAAPISCRRPARRMCVWWCRCCRQVASSSYASIWGWRWSGAHSQPAATVPQPQAGLCGRRERAVALGGHVTWPVAATYVVG